MSYFYRHTNGKVIFKPDFVCESGITPHEYFDSDFVEFWWYEVGRAVAAGAFLMAFRLLRAQDSPRHITQPPNDDR